MRWMMCTVLAVNTFMLAACDNQTDNTPPESPKEAGSAPGDSAPPETASASGVDTPSTTEPNEVLVQRLLDAEFMNPRDAKVKTGPPPISLAPELVDLGDVMPGTKTTGSLTLTNTGDQPLRIIALRSNCACTVPGLESDEIPAGASVEIQLELDATSATGPNQRYVMALFEGYSQPVQLIVQADVNYGVRTQVTYDPPGQSRVATIHLQSRPDAGPFSVISAGGEKPVFADGFDPATDEPRSEYTIVQDFSMYAAEALPKWFLIETDHPTAAVIDIPVPNYELEPVRLRHRFNISEHRLVFGEMKAGERETGSFRVVGGDLGPAAEFVESLEWTNTEQCDVEIVSIVENQGGLDVVVGVTPKEGVRGVLHGTVTLRAMGDARPFDIIGRVVASE